MSRKYIGLDFETFGSVSLPKHGLDRYLSGPDFTPLMASVDAFGQVAVTWDFVLEGKNAREGFLREIFSSWNNGCRFVAHNVGFERGVLRTMGVRDQRFLDDILDSAVVARCQGAASALEAAAPQLASVNKLDAGRALLMKFSVPNEWNSFAAPTAKLLLGDAIALNEWDLYKYYCELDAAASRSIIELFSLEASFSTKTEAVYELLTAEMNSNGWFVDVPLVREMLLRYEANSLQAKSDFARDIDGSLNLNSSAQLKKWCEVRGVKAASFDADHVDQLLAKLGRGLLKISATHAKFEGYSQVYEMLHTKQILGGSSLGKLQKILDLVGLDGRLRDQYMHDGAGQTYRTSAKGVQLQNLKKLGVNHLDMDEVYDEAVELDNEVLAQNLRQVFTAEDPVGELIVGDFSSVESRGLAWLAGEEWKLTAYRKGQDIYKVLASKFSGVPYDDITKEARAEGKYSELSCGYQAGGEAVKDFMHRLGFEIDLEGATERVNQWRDANPAIVELWATLDGLLHEAVDGRADIVSRQLAHNLIARFERIETPPSLATQHPGAKSLKLVLVHQVEGVILERVFHGCYLRGRSVCYYKPTDRKTGDLWKGTYLNPKTKQLAFYSIYGGKLSGILTQSLCRELFFYSLWLLKQSLKGVYNVLLVGQFHDEIVVEWSPPRGGSDLIIEAAKGVMERAMSQAPDGFEGFPLVADIKSDHRYIK